MNTQQTIDNAHMECPHCGASVGCNAYKFHLKYVHKFPVERITRETLYLKKGLRIAHLPLEIKKKYIDRLWEYNQCKKIYDTQLKGTYEHTMAAFGKFDEEDIEYFFSTIIPFKLSHPSQPNSMELANVEAHGDKEKADLIYQKFMRSKNPFVGHGAELSPFSKDFIGYKDLTDEEKIAKAEKTADRSAEDRLPNQIGYWLKKGFSPTEAKNRVAERQRTFTIEKLIEKYGKEEAIRRYKDRQERWQNTLKSKSPEEIERIARAKICNKLNQRSYSLISQRLFWLLYECISKDFQNVYFATRNPYTGQEVEENCEKGIVVDGHCYFLDFYIEEIKVCIEFDGVFWHSLEQIIKKDAKRDGVLAAQGIHVYHVKENDYRNDEQNVIARCLEFIYEHKRKSEETV